MSKLIDRTLFKNLCSILSLLLVGATWAYSSPPGSSFDESVHIGSIWCSSGVVPGKCETPDDEASLTNSALTPFVTDYCFYSGIPATCEKSQPPGTLFEHGVFNRTSSHDFRNIFYKSLGVLILSDARSSIPLMRIANLVIFLIFFSSIILILSGEIQKAAVWGILLCLIPQGIFLIASINPSSWAITSISTSWSLLLWLSSQAIKIHRCWIIGLLVLASLLSLSRLEAPLFLAFILVVILGRQESLRRQLKSWSALIFATLVGIAALTRPFLTWTLGNLRDSFRTPDGIDFHFYWLIHLVDIPALTFGANFEDFGPLGGGDILVPPLVPTIQISALVIVFYLSHRVFSKKVIIFHFVTFAFVYCVLIQQLAVENTHNPYWVQGRYILPLLPFIVGYSIYLSGAARLALPSNLVKLFFALLTISHSVTLLTFIVRFSDGTVLDTVPRPSVVFKLDSWRYVSWLPSSVLWLVGSVAFAVFLWAIYGILIENDQVQTGSGASPEVIGGLRDSVNC